MAIIRKSEWRDELRKMRGLGSGRDEIIEAIQWNLWLVTGVKRKETRRLAREI